MQFVVSSLHADPGTAKARTDFDYCGSIASALRACDNRLRSGLYQRIWFHRARVTKTRARGSRRYVRTSTPMRFATRKEVIAWT